MSEIKIISNPYQKSISFQTSEDDKQSWTDITIDNPHSKLLSKDYTKGFFPFVAKEIIDIIIAEYGENTTVYFEGPDDEFNDLQDIIKNEFHNQLKIAQSETYLSNARDVLPEISEIFGKVKPIVEATRKTAGDTDADLYKFSEVVDNVVPICVLGNYSSGKSTFINALIGNEILPSGEQPVTAKVYKIFNSKQSDRASVKFVYKHEKYDLRFEGEKYRFELKPSDNVLTQYLESEMDHLSEAKISEKMNKVLEILNAYDKEDDDLIDDLIELSVNFLGDTWNQSKYDFVIFDTPGSDSATNKKHMEVLRDAMQNMTNGMPVYISEMDSLDSNDNEALCKEIKEMQELDSRFTIIVVSKADEADLDDADLSRDGQDSIMNEVLPRTLYSEGLFFVSSVMGLGSKNGGQFAGKHLNRIFRKEKELFSDKDDEMYTQLYQFNIQPEQLKRKDNQEAEKLSNVIYANSGLYSVEKEIQTFADKYSPYNKCQQAKLYLDKVITVTNESIKNQTADLEIIKTTLEQKLSADSKALLEQIEQKSDEKLNEYQDNYDSSVQPVIEDLKTSAEKGELESLQNELIERHEAQKSVDEIENNQREAQLAIGDNLWRNIGEVLRNRDLTNIKKVHENFNKDRKKAADLNKDLEEAKQNSEKQAADDLVNLVNQDFKNTAVASQRIIEESSRNYWTRCADEMRSLLRSIVTNDKQISEEKKNQLSDLIFNYEGINLVDLPDDYFEKIDFEYLLKIGNFMLGKQDKLYVDRLRNRYNEEIKKNIDKIASMVSLKHRNSFTIWMNNLIQKLRTNIVEYSPELKKQSDSIKATEDTINDLAGKKAQLDRFNAEVNEKIGWKTV